MVSASVALLSAQEVSGEDRAIQQLKMSQADLDDGLQVSKVCDLIKTRSQSDLGLFPSMWHGRSPSSSCTDSPMYPNEGSYSKYNRVENNLIQQALAKGFSSRMSDGLLPCIDEPTTFKESSVAEQIPPGEEEYIQVDLRVITRRNGVETIGLAPR